MAERYRSGIRGVNENPQPYGREIAILAVVLALEAWGIVEGNLAMVGAGALIYGGWKGRRWFANRVRGKRSQAAEPGV